DDSRLLRVRDSGGAPEEVARPGKDEFYRLPQVLPGETQVLFDIAGLERFYGPTVSTGAVRTGRIAVVALAGGVPKILIRHARPGRYISAGYLVYSSGGSLNAVGFDPKRLELLGSPIKLLDAVPSFALSDTGVLVCARDARRSAHFRLVWVSREG